MPRRNSNHAHARRARGKALKSDPGHSAAVPNARLDWFTWFAIEVAHLTGRPYTFVAALSLILVWAVTGPVFGFSDTWQLVINTGTTIVTFLMVFLIQNTQNRDTLALQIKLAELIISMHGAHNNMATIEDMGEQELETLHAAYRKRAEETFHALHRRRGTRADG
jgi:low affinity Fe/Cu permease